MEKLFNNETQLEAWLSEVLYTEKSESKYEKNQIRLCGITVPVLSQMNREELKRLLISTLSPVLPFVTYQSFCTFEDSSSVIDDVTHYDADDLQELVNIVPPFLIFVDVSKEQVIWHTLTLQEHHTQVLYLDQIIKYLVMHYILEQEEPISYVVTAKAISLQKAGQPAISYSCRDTNCHVMLYQQYLIMKEECQRKNQKIQKSEVVKQKVE